MQLRLFVIAAYPMLSIANNARNHRIWINNPLSLQKQHSYEKQKAPPKKLKISTFVYII